MKQSRGFLKASPRVGWSPVELKTFTCTACTTATHTIDTYRCYMMLHDARLLSFALQHTEVELKSACARFKVGWGEVG